MKNETFDWFLYLIMRAPMYLQIVPRKSFPLSLSTMLERFTPSPAIDSCLCTGLMAWSDNKWFLVSHNACWTSHHSEHCLWITNNISYRWHFEAFHWSSHCFIRATQRTTIEFTSEICSIHNRGTGMESSWYLLASYRPLCLKMDWCANALRVIWVFCWNSSQSTKQYDLPPSLRSTVDCDFIIVWSEPSTLAGVCQT